MSDEKRKGFLENLLGKKDADGLRETLTKATEALDAAKVVRKEGPTPDEIVAAVSQMLTNAGLPDDVVNKVSEAVKVALTPASEAPPASEDAPAEMKSLVKSLGDLVGRQTEDNGLIAQAVVSIATAIKEIAADNVKVKAEIEAMKATLGDRPRQASKAIETEVENSELETKIKEGVDGDMTFLGVKISKPLPSRENGNGAKGK